MTAPAHDRQRKILLWFRNCSDGAWYADKLTALFKVLHYRYHSNPIPSSEEALNIVSHDEAYALFGNSFNGSTDDRPQLQWKQYDDFYKSLIKHKHLTNIWNWIKMNYIGG